MNRTHARSLFNCALSVCFFLGLGLSLGGCNDQSTSNTSGDTHRGHEDHSGHQHGEDNHDDHDDHKGHDDHKEHDHDEHSGNDGVDHDDHSDGEDSHEGHDHGSALRIGPSERREFGIDIATAQPATLTVNISLPGELALNQDNVAHVVHRVAGVTRSVHKSVGDYVQEGDLLAVLDSRELAQTKTQYLAALAKERIAKANFAREDKLWQAKISSERTFLDARQALDEARIARTLAERELHALGISEDDVKTLTTQPEVEYTRYQLTAPIAGTVIERHLVRGEVAKVEAEEPLFVIADLKSVWLNITVYTTHLDHVHPGQKVLITLPHRSTPLTATIDYVTPIVDESTRSASARVVLPNPDGSLRPGLFVTATLALETIAAPISVPKTAILMIEGRPTIFVFDKEVFTPTTVVLGVSNETHTEIRTGLKLGDSYVARGAFVLKSEMQKSELEHAGHAH